MSDDPDPPLDIGRLYRLLPIIERLSRIEAEVRIMRSENLALKSTLHAMIRQMLTDHSASIQRLATAQDTRAGIWWTLVAVAAAVAMLAGGVAWLLENNVTIVFKR